MATTFTTIHAVAAFVPHTQCKILTFSYMATTFIIMLAAAGFLHHTFTVRAKRVEGSTPSARVTWSTTVVSYLNQFTIV